MAVEQIDTVVVGAGQAGIAASEHLSRHNIPHVVLEKDRIAERWRTGRWDSLVANGPAWHDRFPNMEFKSAPDDFPDKDAVADYFVDYATMINAPVRAGVEVLRARPLDARMGYQIETTQGTIEARNIVVATGAFQHPSIPPIVPKDAPVMQIHSINYRNPAELPEGGVLVVGAGSSGAQIADELLRSGKDVYLSIGAHDRPPRAYRGRDFVWWLGVLGLWDLAANVPGKEHVTIAVSGSQGGFTVDFRKFAERGMNLVGITKSYENGVMYFNDDLKTNVDAGDTSYLEMLALADAYIARNGLDFPEEPEAHVIPADPLALIQPTRELNLKDANIATIIWATGFTQDFSWLEADCFDEKGKPIHQRGVGRTRGIYFLGLPWQSRRGSTFIWGVWHDAKFIADQIAIQRQYLNYPSPSANAVKADPNKSEFNPPMAHIRIRKFNTKDTYPEQNLNNDLCQAVVTTGGKTVYMRGQCPQNLDDAKNIESHDPVEQTHKVMQNIRQLIEEAGGTMEHLVKVVVYITDIRYREAIYRTMGEYIEGVYPVSTGLVVQALARPEWLVEIDATAVIPD